MIEINKIYFEDCLIGMQKIDDCSVDFIACDLPYGTTVCKWDVIIPFEPLWKQYLRIIKNNGAICLFGKEPFSSTLRLSNLKYFRYDWVWSKNQSGSFAVAKKMPMQYHEIISVFYKKSPTYNPIYREYSESSKANAKYVLGKNYSKDNNIQNINYIPHGRSSNGAYPKSIIEINADRPRDRLHPSQKPVALLEYFIKTYTNPDEIVLDNCMGSGTTAIACKNTDRNFIGFENDEKYWQLANKRLTEYVQ